MRTTAAYLHGRLRAGHVVRIRLRDGLQVRFSPESARNHPFRDNLDGCLYCKVLGRWVKIAESRQMLATVDDGEGDVSRFWKRGNEQ